MAIINYLPLIYLFLPILALNFLAIGENQNTLITNSLLYGSFSLIDLPQNEADFAYFNGNFYWPAGISPAAILAPFVWIFGTNFQESFLKFPLTILNFLLVFGICQTLKLPRDRSLLLSVFFIFGSVYTPLVAIPISVYFTQVVATTFILLAIYLFLRKSSWLVIGSSLALAISSRSTAIIVSLFFLIFLVRKPFKLDNSIKFFLPVIAAIIVLGYYNYERFGSIFEQGYRYQIIPQEAAERRDSGLFSLIHVPSNLYFMLVKTPNPLPLSDSYILKFPFIKYDPYGMSIFFLSPILFLIFKADFKSNLIRSSVTTSLLMLIPLLTYYGIGKLQIGYRYALDFYPFLLLMLITATKNVNLNLLRILTISGVLLTWFFIIEFYGKV